MAILIEHFGGKWPFFISPRQVCIIPVNVAKYGGYAKKIRDKLSLQGYYVELDDSSLTLNKRIRNA